MPFDIAEHLGAVHREVRNVERDGQSAKDLVASRYYDTDIADLWDAITDADRVRRWFSPVSGELRLGGRYAVEGNASGTITACDAPRYFAATWEFMGHVSWIEVFLEPAGNGTRLELHHIAPHPNRHWDQYGAGAGGVGWELGLLGLAEHLKRPADDVRAEGLGGWETSPEAKELVRAAAAGWGEASIGGGDNPDKAMRAAEATRRFYSGEPPAES